MLDCLALLFDPSSFHQRKLEAVVCDIMFSLCTSCVRVEQTAVLTLEVNCGSTSEDESWNALGSIPLSRVIVGIEAEVLIACSTVVQGSGVSGTWFGGAIV